MPFFFPLYIPVLLCTTTDYTKPHAAFFTFRFQYLPQSYSNHRRCNQNRTLHKQSEGQYICVTVFFFFFFLYFLKAIFFAKIEIDNHHQANQCHQHKSCLRRYPTPPASECEIYQQRLEQTYTVSEIIFFLTTFLS